MDVANFGEFGIRIVEKQGRYCRSSERGGKEVRVESIAFSFLGEGGGKGGRGGRGK